VPTIRLKRIALSLDGTTAESVGRIGGAGFDPGQGELRRNAVILHGANNDQLLPLAAMVERRAEGGATVRQPGESMPSWPTWAAEGGTLAGAGSRLYRQLHGRSKNRLGELCFSLEDQTGARC
jgi:hypothetical protein